MPQIIYFNKAVRVAGCNWTLLWLHTTKEVQKVKNYKKFKTHCEQECNRHHTLLSIFPVSHSYLRGMCSSTQKWVLLTSRVNSVFAQSRCNDNMALTRRKKITPVLSKIRNHLPFQSSLSKTTKTEETPLSPTYNIPTPLKWTEIQTGIWNSNNALISTTSVS